VVLVGLGGLSVLAFFYYLSQRNKPAVVNVRPTPAPPRANANAGQNANANANAGASPTPGLLNEAAQRAEQKIRAGALVSPADLSGVTSAQLRLLRNTVYARYGRVFRDEELQQYFLKRPWYRPRADYDDRLLTTNDRANADLLKSFEDNGGRPPEADASEVSKEVGDALEGWADAERERDLDDHMSYYADTLETFYKRQNVPAAQVRAERSKAFERYDHIDVRLSNVQVTPDPTGARATAVFDKTWRFEGGDKDSSGSVRQQVTLVRIGGHWLINGERDLQVYFSNSVDSSQ
jgi:ketosteroid isomerase-like protein